MAASDQPSAAPEVRLADWSSVGRIHQDTTARTAMPSNSATDDPLSELYEAPEGRLSQVADRQALDIFSLGAVAYFLLSGGPPAADRMEQRERLKAGNGLDLAAGGSSFVTDDLRWSHGWVEPVRPTPAPRHIVGQQILAAALADHGLELANWRARWGCLPLFDGAADRILRHLLNREFLDVDGGIAFIGPEAEKHYGRRHFMELLAVFASPPQFRVLAGRREIGSVGVEVLLDDTVGTILVLLAGRSWKVTHIDWRRRQCFVEEVAAGGKARWITRARPRRTLGRRRYRRPAALIANPRFEPTQSSSRPVTGAAAPRRVRGGPSGRGDRVTVSGGPP